MNDKKQCKKLGIMFICTGAILVCLGTCMIMKSKTM